MLCIFADMIIKIEKNMRKKLTTEEFVERARRVHGDKYDYSKVKYDGSFTKICIICPEHGEFWQTPANHLNGAGCSVCAGTLPMNTDDFIRKARKTHGDKYDYSKVKYVNGHAKVCIVCPEHGEFWQIASAHIRGRGCPKCGYVTSMQKRKFSTSKFIENARKVHGQRYDYSKVEYDGANNDVVIVCPQHGEFRQKAAAHLYGCGCPVCAGKKRTTERFIEEARNVHGNKYDYSKVEYVNVLKKVCIICPEHGDFWQTPSMHLNGQGCPACAGNVKMTNEEFVKKARHVHGDRYEYSRVEYVNNVTPVIIKCPEHGEFLQRPASHLAGCGCPKCAFERKRNAK